MAVKTGRLVKLILEDDSAIDVFFPHGEFIATMATEGGCRFALDRTEAQQLVNAMRKEAKHTEVSYGIKMAQF